MERLPDLQAAVRALEGVAWASVIWPDPHGPATLHVAFEPTADQEAVVRAVFAATEAVADVGPGALEVRPLRPAAPPAAPVSARPGRPALRRFTAEDAEQAEVTVALDHRGRTVSASIEGAGETGVEPRLAAAAALRALREVLPEHSSAELDWVEVLRAPLPGHPDVVNVAVTLRTGEDEERHVGAAMVRRSAPEAAVRATLDALNRRLERLVEPPA